MGFYLSFVIYFVLPEKSDLAPVCMTVEYASDHFFRCLRLSQLELNEFFFPKFNASLGSSDCLLLTEFNRIQNMSVTLSR